MEKKKKNNWFFKILILLFILFLCLYSMGMNGYIESINKNKTLYTEEQIKKFEEAIEKGEYLDLQDIKIEEKIDYSNKVSDLGVKISDLIAYLANKSIDLFNDVFSYLFE